MSGQELLLRLIAAWGGFGWARVRERYDQIVPPGKATAEAALSALRSRGEVERDDEVVLVTKAGLASLAKLNRARLEAAKERVGYRASDMVEALLCLVWAMQPTACDLFEGVAHDVELERVSAALDVAAASVGVDLNPRTYEDARAGLGGAA